MAYTTIENLNISGIDDVVIYINSAVPIFIPTLLLLIWLAVTSLIYFGTRKFSGSADIFAAASSAGFLTVVLGTTLTLGTGIINVWTITTMVAIVIISFILLMIKRERD